MSDVFTWIPTTPVVTDTQVQRSCEMISFQEKEPPHLRPKALRRTREGQQSNSCQEVALEAAILRHSQEPKLDYFLMFPPTEELLGCLVWSCLSEKDEHKTSIISIQVLCVPLCFRGHLVENYFFLILQKQLKSIPCAFISEEKDLIQYPDIGTFGYILPLKPSTSPSVICFTLPSSLPMTYLSMSQWLYMRLLVHFQGNSRSNDFHNNTETLSAFLLSLTHI